MFKYLLVFLCLISSSLLTYRPMSRKTIDFGGNVCYQKEYNGVIPIEYVRPCSAGKYCHSTDSSGNDLGTCETYTQIIKTLGETCESNIECDNGLVCNTVDGEKQCTLTSTTPYSKHDSIRNTDIFYYCLSGKIAYSTDVSSISCNTLPSDVSNNKYLYIKESTGSSTTYKIPPGPYQVKGKISFKETSGIYSSSSIDISDIGSVDAGNFVEDERACKSGFTLKFYVNGNNPVLPKFGDTLDSRNIFKLCVNVKEVELDSLGCKIKYTISNEDEKIYYLSQMSESSSICSNLMTKLEMFKNYIEKLEPIKAECKSKNYYEEPFTCRNDELRKWWYFFYNPDKYMLYKDQTEVVEYLLQSQYKTYNANKGSFLNMNYLFSLLILLFL